MLPSGARTQADKRDSLFTFDSLREKSTGWTDPSDSAPSPVSGWARCQVESDTCHVWSSETCRWRHRGCVCSSNLYAKQLSSQVRVNLQRHTATANRVSTSKNSPKMMSEFSNLMFCVVFLTFRRSFLWLWSAFMKLVHHSDVHLWRCVMFFSLKPNDTTPDLMVPL